MEEEEEAVVLAEPLQELDPAAEGPFQRTVAVAVPGYEAVEAAAEAKASAHEAALGEAGRAEAVALKDLGEQLDLGREDRVGRKDAVLPRVEPGEHGHVGDQRARELGVGLLEQRAPLREGVEERARGPAVPVGTQVVGPSVSIEMTI